MRILYIIIHDIRGLILRKIISQAYKFILNWWVIITISFFFSPSNFDTANEICDKFAAAGFYANMITYLTQQLNLPLVKASNTLTNFGGMGSFTPLIGALIADSFAGRYWTIIGGSIIYELVTSSHPLYLSQR